MVYFKSCPRCNGDMHANSDMYGEYRECLNCGHMIDIPRDARKWWISEAKPGRRRKGGAYALVA